MVTPGAKRVASQVGTAGAPAPATVLSPGNRRAMRSIAVFEGMKGVLAIAAALGLFSLLRHDLHHVAATLIGNFGLSPGDHYPALLLHYADLVEDTNRRTLALLAIAYVAVRSAEAYGLWHERLWGQWLAAFSGAIYVPFEVQHLAFKPTIAGAVVLFGNVAVVTYLGVELWRERKAKRAGAREAPGAIS